MANIHRTEQLAHITTLPQMIRATVQDIEKCEADPEIAINMQFWFEQYGNTIASKWPAEPGVTCMVCAAGAVAIQSLDVDKGYAGWTPHSAHQNDESKLIAMDHVRMSDIFAAVCSFYNPSNIELTHPTALLNPLVSQAGSTWVSYADDPTKFKQWMLKVADDIAVLESNVQAWNLAEGMKS